MTKCKACGHEFRKGMLAFLLTPQGLKGARVCQSCAAGGVLIVASTLAPVIKQARKNDDGVARSLTMLRNYASAARASVVASPGALAEATIAHHQGRAEGFEGAIEVLKRECAT